MLFLNSPRSLLSRIPSFVATGKRAIRETLETNYKTRDKCSSTLSSNLAGPGQCPLWAWQIFEQVFKRLIWLDPAAGRGRHARGKSSFGAVERRLVCFRPKIVILACVLDACDVLRRARACGPQPLRNPDLGWDPRHRHCVRRTRPHT